MASKALRITLVTAIAIGALPILGGSALATFFGVNGRLAFVALGPAGYDVFTMEPDGADRRLLRHTASDEQGTPVWSPAGTAIASVPGQALVVSNSDGTGAHTVVPGTGCGAANPSWSSDGTQLLFADCTGLDRIGVDGIGRADVLEGAFSGSWSPDGSTIVASKFNAGDYDLFTVTPDALDLTRITDLPGDELAPDWSPDGTSIVFTNANEVWRVEADGSNATNLTNRTGPDTAASWSPDGTRILYYSTELQRGLHTMSPNGSDVRAVPGGNGIADADWQPLYVDLDVSRRKVNYLGDIVLTASLAFPGTNPVVEIWRQPVGGTAKLVSSGSVISGVLSVPFQDLKGRSDFWAEWSGDSDHGPALSNRVRVGVVPSVRHELRKGYGRAGIYGLYHKGAVIPYIAWMIPNHEDSRLCVSLYRLRATGWRRIVTKCFGIRDAAIRVVIVGLPIQRYRIASAFRGDSDHLPATTGWRYFRITS